MKTLFIHYPLPVVLTLIVWLLIGWYLGLGAFVTVVILTFLEVSLSVDNAVVNSRVLATMSRFWQMLFMTVGIFIAVFLIRFALPIIIVAVSANLGSGEVLNLAINKPDEYGHKLHDASPMINAFGGVFLSLVSLYFFVSSSRSNFWLKRTEKLLAKINRWKFAKPFFIASLFVIIYFTVNETDRTVVGLSALAAILIYLLLHGVTVLMEKLHKTSSAIHKTGIQAFTAFLYLEVLDASFSLDGVIGAFAITDNIFIIMAGLGVGAIWVRSITLHLVKSHALLRYKYLESGAHWAILLLGLIMLAKLYAIELPEWIIGSVGLVMIALSVMSSRKIIHKQKESLS